jgi:hypothetical protein
MYTCVFAVGMYTVVYNTYHVYEHSAAVPPPVIQYKRRKKATPLHSALQISLDLCIPEKELAKTRSQISFI